MLFFCFFFTSVFFFQCVVHVVLLETEKNKTKQDLLGHFHAMKTGIQTHSVSIKVMFINILENLNILNVYMLMPRTLIQYDDWLNSIVVFYTRRRELHRKHQVSGKGHMFTYIYLIKMNHNKYVVMFYLG